LEGRTGLLRPVERMATNHVEQVTEKYLHEQTVLLALTNQLLSHSTLEDAMSYLVEEVVRLLAVDACALLLPEEQSSYLIFSASTGWISNPVVERRRILNGEHSSAAGKVMHTQTPILSKDSAHRDDMPDLTLDWLEEEAFEGVAIVPLVVEGESIGALAVTTRKPLALDKEEIRFLEILANQAGIAIVNARLREEEIRLQRLEEELSVGRKIQRSLLPASSPSFAGWQFNDLYRPARQVGGDLYDYFVLPDGGHRLGLVIGDVAGQGVPAALFMATSRTLIRSLALADLTPESTLCEANKLILQDSPSDMFLSAFYGILDTRKGTLSFANAGHNPPLLYRKARGDFLELYARGILLCVQDRISLEEKFVTIDRNDILVLYTDGVTEAMNKHEEEFGVDRLRQAIADHAGESAAQILYGIVGAIDSFVGETEQLDDLTLVVAKRL
jgi:serine phosphatase RsbU (regulator of sigma subunit)